MFSDVIKTHVRDMVANGKWGDLFQYLDHMSHSNFKSAKFILESDVLLLAPPPVFWDAAYRLVAYRPKAFLNSVAKVARNRSNRGDRQVDFDALSRIASLLEGEEAQPARHRFIRYVLPLMQSAGDVDALFGAFGVSSLETRALFLREVPEPLHFFLLFACLRRLDDHGMAADCCRFLMRQGDDLSYNLASLLKGYFDLKDVKGVFSLRLQPYEYGYLENSFPAFEKTIRKV